VDQVKRIIPPQNITTFTAGKFAVWLLYRYDLFQNVKYLYCITWTVMVT